MHDALGSNYANLEAALQGKDFLPSVSPYFYVELLDLRAGYPPIVAGPGPLSTADSLLLGLDDPLYDENVIFSILPRDSNGAAITEDDQVIAASLGLTLR